MIRETTAPQDITWLKIDEVYPYECNNKIHKQPEITKIANSIKEFGWTYPILIDENNIVLAGHKRLLAAKQIGLTEVPTIRKDDLSDAQKRAYRIIDNKSSEESEYDPTNLTLELDEIKALDFDISKFINLNFDLDKIGETQDLGTQEDDYDAEPPAEPKTKYGDIYQLGNHRLMCGDSTKEEDVAKLMNGQLADMIFTDPPYGVSYVDKNDFLNRLGKPMACVKPIQNDSRKPEEMYDFWVQAFSLLHKFTKEKMSYYITAPQGGDLLLLLLLQSIRDSGFMLKHQLVWNKNNHVLGRCDYNYKHEPIIYGWKIAGTHTFYGNGKFKTSVWDIPKPIKSDLHPTMKPIELVENAILDVTKEGDIIVDSFLGSGTTLISAEKTNRICYGMELDPAYCDVIIDRWEKFTGQKAQKIED